MRLKVMLKQGGNMNKVVLIGCGNVGMSYAFSLVSDSKVDELVLIDINKQKAEGEALDLLHASSCAKRKIKIKAGDYSDCSNADIICLCAGRNQEKGETRLDLIDKNLDVFRSIITEINKTKFNGIYLIATNPLDVMTYITLKLSKFPKNRVVGSGTTLDTARLKFKISEELNVDPNSINACVIGEHGDSEMIPWSNAMIGSTNVGKYISRQTKARITKDVRNSAYEIINKKGNTAYGIGMCLRNITDAILENSNKVFTLSVYNEKYKICIGGPAIINKDGVREILKLDLSPEEQQEFNASVQTIKDAVKRLKL